MPLLPLTTFLAPHNRREQGRLGSSFGTTQSDSFRHVVPPGVSSAHQHPGNESCSISSHRFPGTSSGLVRDVVHRQHISRLLRSGSGRDTLTLPLPGDQGSASPLSGSELFPLSQTHIRSPQCPGRRSVSKTPVTSFGVDSPSGSGQPDLFLSRSSPRRSVCNQGQQQITYVRKSSLQCSSMGSRRAFVRVGPTGRLRLSPTHSHSPDSGENQGERLPDCSCRPLVAQETLVKHNSRSPVRLPQEASSQKRPSVPERQMSCGPRHVPLTRLAVIRRSLQMKRFSAWASAFIDSARRKSTRAVYDARWKLFSEWCLQREIDPVNPSSRRIADFLLYLFDDKKLSLSSIKGYHSMLSHTLAFHRSSQVCSDPAILKLIRAMELKRPVSRSLTLSGIWHVFCGHLTSRGTNLLQDCFSSYYGLSQMEK